MGSMLFLNVTFLPAFTSQNNHPGFEKTVCGKPCGNAKVQFAFCLTRIYKYKTYHYPRKTIIKH